MPDKKIEISEAKLRMLMEQLKEKNADIDTLVNVIASLCRVLGLVDEKTGKVKPEYLTGQENIFTGVAKGIGDVLVLMTQSKVPVIGKQAEKKLNERFAFMADIAPLIIKYT